MNGRSVKLIDASGNVLATAHVADEGNHYGGTIDLCCTPAPVRALFEEFEEIVNAQMFSLLDDVQGKIDSLVIKAVFDNGQEEFVKDLQIFPNKGDVSFKVAEDPLPEAQKQDLERRLTAYEANPKAGATWEEVKARLQERP